MLLLNHLLDIAGRGGWGGQPYCVPGWSTQYGRQEYDWECNDGGSPGDVYDTTPPLTLRPGSGGGGGEPVALEVLVGPEVMEEQP